MEIAVPIFVKAKTPEKLIERMLEANDIVGGRMAWGNIQHVNGHWYSWAESTGRRPAGG